MFKKLILLAGPTASGKSNLAIKLAKKINGEIINADSMQVFKEFTILSSRPGTIQMRKVKHHLYGIISVKKHFSAGDWLKQAKKKIKICLKKKKVPIIVGGTGLYFNTITKGISKIPNIDKKTRNKVRNLYKKLGIKRFYKQLLNLDPKIKDKILQTDSQRLQRAYEVKLKTKKSLFDWFANTKSDFLDFEMKKIFPLELKKLMDSDKNEFQLVDIRDEYEYDICCIGGEKINMYSIIDNLDKLSREKKVIIYCRTGSRSANIVNLLESSYSFQNVYNLEGGIMKWRDDIDPTIKEY